MLPVGTHARIDDDAYNMYYDEEIGVEDVEYNDQDILYQGTGADFGSENTLFKITNNDYRYNAVSGLSQNYANIGDDEVITMVFYKVDTNAKVPFLLFGFELSSETHAYQFIRVRKGDIHFIDTLSRVMGYLRDDTGIYLFHSVDVTNEVNIMMNIMFSNVHFLLVDEVVNRRQVFKCGVNDDIYNFFKTHPEFVFLYTPFLNAYEIPSVGYVGGNMKGYNFISRFGITPSELSAPFGVGYYFTDYISALEHSKKRCRDYLNPIFSADTKNSAVNKSIVYRFAMFLGKTKVMLNKPDDVIDQSLFKTQQLADTNDNACKRARMTLRITDHDSIWKMTHESIYAGDVELDDGSVYQDGPLWCLRDYDQQYLLTFQPND